jgi:dTDP-4-dehydrorhamnose 3,5-epimerase
MKVHPTKLEGVRVVEPTVHRDARGFFLESYAFKTLQAFGIDTQFVQDNHSRSVQNTLRGLHYQVSPGQAKLVRVLVGEIFDVAVDLRPDSPTFGQWVGQTLSAENFLQMYIPIGFAHGFCVLSPYADVAYKASAYYDPQAERGLAWDDPAIGIAWPIGDPILSERDRRHPTLDTLQAENVGA